VGQESQVTRTRSVATEVAKDLTESRQLLVYHACGKRTSRFAALIAALQAREKQKVKKAPVRAQRPPPVLVHTTAASSLELCTQRVVQALQLWCGARANHRSHAHELALE